MKIQKKHILVSALVLALGAAVYLNWHFSDSPLVLPTSKELGAATYVSKNTSATADEAEAASKTTLTPQDQLAKSRTERSQAQDKALDAAKNIITLSDSSDEAKEEAVEQAGEIEKRILAQSNIENILAAKGYPDCLCYLSDSGCTVTILADEMQKDAPLIIRDVVMSQTEVDFNDIVIVDL
jgi:stage III sporulation protein AH